MPPKVELKLVPAVGGGLAKTYTAVKMHGQGCLSLHVLGMEATAGVESQIRDIFSDFRTSLKGNMATAVRMRGVAHLVEKPLGTILEAARALDSELTELDKKSKSLRVYVDFRPKWPAKGETRGRVGAIAPTVKLEEGPRAAIAVSKRRRQPKTAHRPCLKTTAACQSVCTQVMAQWYPMDKTGAYYLAGHEKVKAAWAEGMLSLTQLLLHEQEVAVDEREAIKGYMFRKARNQRAAIGGYGSTKPTAEALQELARKAAEWNEQYDALIDAGGLPEALADANRKAGEKGFLRAEGGDCGLQDQLKLTPPGQACAKETRTKSRQLEAPQKPVVKHETGPSSRARRQEKTPLHNGDAATAGRCKEDGGDEDTQAKAMQSSRAPGKRKARESVAQSAYPVKQERLAITSKDAGAAKLALKGAVLARGLPGDGGQSKKQPAASMVFIDLTADDMDEGAAGPSTHEPEQEPRTTVTEEMARAAVTKRRSVAIPENELAQLGLSQSMPISKQKLAQGGLSKSLAISADELPQIGLGKSITSPNDELAQLGPIKKSPEPPVAAQLFWAGEGLMDVGDGRFYPRRYVQAKGDMPMRQWMQKQAQCNVLLCDYPATAIVDERTYSCGSRKEYIVKWEGFQLNAGQWLPHEMLARTNAMREWALRQAANVQLQAYASRHAQWAHLSGSADKPSPASKLLTSIAPARESSDDDEPQGKGAAAGVKEG